MRDPLGPPPSARHPGDIFLQILCLSAGLGLAVSPEQPGALEKVLPDWLTASWAGFLIFGSLAVLVGVFLRNRLNGLLLEFWGRILLVIGAAIYAGAFVMVSGGLTFSEVWPLLVFAVFMAWRARHIMRDIGELRSTLALMTWARENRDEP